MDSRDKNSSDAVVASGSAIVPDTLPSAPYTTSAALLDALNELGIEYIFANCGRHFNVRQTQCIQDYGQT